MSLICTDKNIEDECIWIVTLSDGTVVYQDDNSSTRPTGSHHSAWVRLREYLAGRDLSIASWRLQFRSHIVELPTGIAYVYSRSIMGTMSGGADSTTHYHIVGVVQSGEEEIERVQYHSPALIETDKKHTVVKDIHHDMIIWNKGNTNG